MVNGAVASIIYGEPRLTHDIDLVLELSDEDAEELVEVFPLEEFYCPPIEILRLEIKRPQRGHFNLIPSGDRLFSALIYQSQKEECDIYQRTSSDVLSLFNLYELRKWIQVS